jgi:hypothetical protein
MFFDSEALPSRSVTGFHWLKPTPSLGPSVSRHRSSKRPCSTFPGAGLGSRPVSVEQPIPLPRLRKRDHGASLFCYEFARTTLLGRWTSRRPTSWNCFAIAPSHRSRETQKAGTSRRHGAYFARSAARRQASASRCLRFPLPHSRLLPNRPVHCWPASGKHRG